MIISYQYCKYKRCLKLVYLQGGAKVTLNIQYSVAVVLLCVAAYLEL